MFTEMTLGNPRQFNLEFCPWTRRVPRDLVRGRLKGELSTSSVSRKLRGLGGVRRLSSRAYEPVSAQRQAGLLRGWLETRSDRSLDASAAEGRPSAIAVSRIP